ncbi:MAG: hypothetical protein GC178_01000 [Flavobacteriales bacterium]|nr:hypothetical protein [Flavobacteriales bacterium]
MTEIDRGLTEIDRDSTENDRDSTENDREKTEIDREWTENAGYQTVRTDGGFQVRKHALQTLTGSGGSGDLI